MRKQNDGFGMMYLLPNTYHTQVITWLALAAVVAAALAGITGAYLGYRYGKESGDAALATLQTDVARANGLAYKSALEHYSAETERGQALAGQLAAAQGQIDQQRTALSKRTTHVTTVYVERPGQVPVPLPRTVFTLGFVHEYNAAFDLSAYPAPASASGAVGAAAEAAAFDAELQDARLSQPELLAHIVDVGTWCRKVEAQRDQLIDYVTAAP